MSPVSSIDKHEGGFNKALKLAMENGKEVVVKIPFPAMVPVGYSIFTLADSVAHKSAHGQPSSSPTTTLPKIVGVIDWQFTSISPAFTQVRWPHFLEPPEDHQTGAIKPELPADFEIMDPDEQAYALSQRDQTLQAKCYEVALAQRDREAYLALIKVPDTVRRLFTLCDRTFKNGVVPLRDCLIQLSSNWHRIGLSGSCPITVSSEEMTAHETQLGEYRDWVQLRKYTQEILCSDEEGWVSPELDSEKVRAQERELFGIYLRRQAPDTLGKDAKVFWFYPPV
ncbi:hypothetical protein Z517_03394 [Fonsecaea pedrosoi CBS 271.37]|uniref:Aminoglycoside phosphotransferase domain-containing protein n=1 Tax=Fonsecaea pedrosoi CBS 271.37 TaxID=1442368 RepID=A0A0D2FBY1_9EURO|nr:uncharacterized protein Z517_03394 [Fonsecaea pedrosoi CBS 271.37]KIW84147.1 hypothetical protein Z517_03394 [Fonsecaea pedrosoi CBS 271.37]